MWHFAACNLRAIPKAFFQHPASAAIRLAAASQTASVIAMWGFNLHWNRTDADPPPRT
jgi:hypothetical protein